MTSGRLRFLRNVSIPGLVLTAGLLLVVPVAVGVTLWVTSPEPSQGALEPAPSASSADGGVDADPTPPPVPAAAQQMTEDGAKAFVQYWFDVMDWSYTNSSTDYFATLGDPTTCSACAFAVKDVAEMTQNDEFTQGSNWTVTSFVVKEFRQDNTGFVFTLTLKSDVETVTNSAGETLRENPARSDLQREVAVVWQENRWIMSQTAQGEG